MVLELRRKLGAHECLLLPGRLREPWADGDFCIPRTIAFGSPANPIAPGGVEGLCAVLVWF